MKKFTLLLALSFLTLNPIPADACQSGNPLSLAYIRRDNNRCEGINSGNNRSVAGRFNLIAFSTGIVKQYPDILRIRVPGTKQNPPIVQIQSSFRDYFLDSLVSRFASNHHIFDLNTKNVLKSAQIPPNTLRAIAYFEQRSTRKYFPVILGTPTNFYQFIVYSSESRSFPKVEIRRQGKVIPSNLKPTTIADDGEISFAWKPNNTPAGNYEFYLVDNKGKDYNFSLEHNPQWLR